MTVAARLGELQQQREEMQRASDFISLAKILLESEGKFVAARHIAERTPRVSARVRSIMASPEAQQIFQRAAAPPLTLVDSTPLTEYRLALAGFASSLANFGVFDRLLSAGFRRIPLALLAVGATNVGVTAAVVSEASAKPVSSVSLSSATTTVRKAAALVVVTKELARASEDVSTILGQEMRKGVVAAIDSRFISIATAGVSPIVSSGTNFAAFWDDLGTALYTINIDADSRLYLLLTSRNAKALSILLAESTSSTTAMTPRGGTIAGIETLVSDSLAADSMVLLDATAFAAASGDLSLSSIGHSTFQLDTSPDSPAVASTNVISLWAQNLFGLLCERFFLCERLRTGAVASVTGASYASGFSP